MCIEQLCEDNNEHNDYAVYVCQKDEWHCGWAFTSHSVRHMEGTVTWVGHFDGTLQYILTECQTPVSISVGVPENRQIV